MDTYRKSCKHNHEADIIPKFAEWFSVSGDIDDFIYFEEESIGNEKNEAIVKPTEK